MSAKRPAPKPARRPRGLAGLVAELRSHRTGTAPGTRASRSSDRQALRRALQGAATLELATIPPYLCALWSVRDDRHPVANAIREIVQEEMLHLALVTNLLVGIKGEPVIDRTCLRYPTELPMGVHPGLTVRLGALDDDRLLEFMHIERPRGGIVVRGGRHPRTREAVELASAVPKGATIGDLYEEIRASFHRLPPDEQSLRTDRQITGPLAWSSTWSLQGVDHAIDLIKRQGEGAETVFDQPGDPAHFYRFWEVLEGRRIEVGARGAAPTFGAKVAFDPRSDVFPMAIVPKGGYRRSDVADSVWCHLSRFDSAFSTLLDSLQEVWTRDGGQASFWGAIPAMFELEKHARALMQIEVPGRRGRTYGPCFRYIPKARRD